MSKLDGFLILENSFISTPKVMQDNANGTVIEVILQQAEIPNRNGRIYGRDALKEAIYSPVVQEKIKNKAFVGEAGHPLSDDIKRQTYIDQTRISHIVTQCNFDGDLLKGTVESAKTLVGKDFQGMIRQGTNVAFSMRGLGGVSKKQGNYNRIDGPLHIISYDWVMFPSHHNAYMQKVVSEDVNILDVDKQMLMEGATFNLNMKDLAKYVAESSNNVKELSEHTGFQLLNENTSIDIRNKTLDIQQGGDVLKVFLEDQIHRELDSYFGSMKFKI